jgi:hypothetical protein
MALVTERRFHIGEISVTGRSIKRLPQLLAEHRTAHATGHMSGREHTPAYWHQRIRELEREIREQEHRLEYLQG